MKKPTENQLTHARLSNVAGLLKIAHDAADDAAKLERDAGRTANADFFQKIAKETAHNWAKVSAMREQFEK